MILMKDIIREGHETLRLKAVEVELPLSAEHRQLGEDLLEFLLNSQDPELAEKYGLRSGIGIAAPQVNQSVRMFALHVPNDQDEMLTEVVINPKIVSHSVEETYLPGGEGCLSVDRDVDGYVPRPQRITVKYTNLEGVEKKVRLKNLPAIAFQHELDHLNGVMFYDHINKDNPFFEVPNSHPLTAD